MVGDCSFSTISGCRDYYVNTDVSHRHFNIGACDYFWSYLSGQRYALYGGGCHHDLYCGWLYLNVIHASELIDWAIGACDFLWGDGESYAYSYVSGMRDVPVEYDLYGITTISIKRGPHAAMWWLGA